MDDLRYPIGKFVDEPFSEDLLRERLLDIRALPQEIEYAVTNLDHHHLDTPYRDGGWTVKQVVHHVADSHMNAYIRFKLALTETKPTIRPYEQAAWAELPDSQNVPVNLSVTLLFALHARWGEILKHLTPDQWNLTVYHPEHKKEMSLWYLLGMYAWHGRHHVAHITRLRERMGW